MLESLPALDTLDAYPYTRALMEEETAVCVFYLDGLAVYRTESGGYRCYHLLQEDREFFGWGQIEPVGEMECLPQEYMERVAILEQEEGTIRHFDLHLAEIRHFEGADFFFLYDASQQVFVTLDLENLNRLSPRTVEELRQLEPEPNTLATPLKLLLDEDGRILREVDAHV